MYIMSSLTRFALYTGMNNNLIRRTSEHKAGHGSRFTRIYKCTRLVYYEVYDDVRLAIEREKQIKAGSRLKKIALIESINPRWKDLFYEL